MTVQELNSELNTEVTWHTVCDVSDLIDNSGICALVKGEQIAIFYVSSKMLAEPALYALSNYDPIGKANVMSRGILGTIEDDVVIASPLYKQHFSLQTGECIELPEHQLKTYPVRLQNDDVQIAL